MKKMPIPLLALLCTAAPAAPAATLAAQAEPEPQDNFEFKFVYTDPEVGVAELAARVEKINAELATLDRQALPEDHWAREWAGTYHTGGGRGGGIQINIAPESGITYTSRGCLGLYGYNYGEIKEVLPDGLLLNLRVAQDEDGYEFMDERVYFVVWGPVRYLVPETQMLQFVNNYNQGGYARSSMYFIPVANAKPRWGSILDSGPPVYGPILPEPWAEMLLAEPVTLSVTSVETQPYYCESSETWDHRGTITFDAGTKDGIYEGFKFGLNDCYITIKEVDENSCSGTVRDYMVDKDEPIGIEIGEEITLPNWKRQW